MSWLGLRPGDRVRLATTGEIVTVVGVHDDDVTVDDGSRVFVVPAHQLDLADSL